MNGASSRDISNNGLTKIARLPHFTEEASSYVADIMGDHTQVTPLDMTGRTIESKLMHINVFFFWPYQTSWQEKGFLFRPRTAYTSLSLIFLRLCLKLSRMRYLKQPALLKASSECNSNHT